jgi:hypothetical protein
VKAKAVAEQAENVLSPLAKQLWHQFFDFATSTGNSDEDQQVTVEKQLERARAVFASLPAGIRDEIAALLDGAGTAGGGGSGSQQQHRRKKRWFVTKKNILKQKL